jgi:hypothetical protein
MHPMAPRPICPAALFRLAGKSPRRCPALLNAPSTAHSGASNCFFQAKRPVFIMKNSLFIVFLFVSLAVQAEVPFFAEPSAAGRVVSFSCKAFYLPARSIWKRLVDFEFDTKGVRTIRIDGVAVYTFTIDGSSIMTAVDGERIQIDAAQMTWSSDLRGIVSSQGHCE